MVYKYGQYAVRGAGAILLFTDPYPAFPKSVGHGFQGLNDPVWSKMWNRL
jgi:hypothetical protein